MARFFRFLLLLLTLWGSPVSAHSGKARFHLLIDTDGAADDLRTLCLLLSNREAEVLAVVASDGVLPPDETARRVRALLHEFHHEGIPVGLGRTTQATPSALRNLAMQTRWAPPAADTTPFPAACDLLAACIAGEPERVTVAALGPLTNWSDLLQSRPELAPRIERILWYDELSGGFNRRCDSVAARRISRCGVPVEIVSADPQRPVPVARLLDTLATIENPYARKIVTTHCRPPLEAPCRSHHLAVWDDLVALRLFAPELFVCRPAEGSVRHCLLQTTEIAPACAAILRGRPDAENRIFYAFPTAPEHYAADVAPLIAPILRRHGASEWRAAVLTNELHGHLGIYATIGVKMGIRAREYFAIGIDDMAVTSLAGSRPPVSCLNDGLQVATGGTAGHGLLTVAEVGAARPEALFRFKNRTIRLRLKPEIAARICDDVQRGVAQYGPDSEPYWQYVRALALRYWQEFDRHEIFGLTEETEE